MKYIVKTISLLSIIAVIPGAIAATSRVSMVSKTSPRLPSIAGYVLANTGATPTTTTNSSTAMYKADVDCINDYTDCIKGDDVCGPDFEECTTNVLFHGQMSKCLNTLYQCNASGVAALFGTGATINNLSEGVTKTSDGEVARYTYPTDSSALGQMIISGSISNQLTTEQCVRRYTNCLHRDDICGADFELCTDGKSFKKQALLCDSTLARCQNEGKTQLFGAITNASTLRPTNDSRLGTMIDEGAALAALNAVKTCQRVTDNCLVGACTRNPLSCVEGTSLATIAAADIVAGASDPNSINSLATVAVTDDMYTEATTASNIRKILKTQCLETIGANQYCHMTYLEKKPSKKELGDPDLQEEVFSLAYSARKTYVNTKIQEEMKKFDADTKNKCIDTISSCVMRSCGGGIGSVCYANARNTTTGATEVNGNRTYKDIQAGCSAIVNADANCIYAATSGTNDGYKYAFTKGDTFTTLFPEHTGSESDPIGAVATLNSVLATSYNDAAIENMRKQCQTVALSCVKSMCGTDYEYCYRNRTDIMAGTYNTSKTRFDNSMNKMGGVLDYNIVIGLCMNTVKDSSVCNEHLKIAAAKIAINSTDTDTYTTTWGSNTSVRGAWAGANSVTASDVANPDTVVIACTVSTPSDNCPEGIREEPDDNGDCIGIMDENGCVYDTPVTQKLADYKLENAGTTLFQELLADVEKEVQAKYNAKLTKEQNVCLAQNQGGIQGAADNGSTFMWVKLKSNKVPKNYNMKGLTTKQFTASNDLYGSFCRARVTVTSDDKAIQEILGDKATAYFAVGDPFTCGSWIDNKTLEKITTSISEKARKAAGEGSTKDKNTLIWATVAPSLIGGVASYFGMDAIQKNGGSLGGLLNSKGTDAQKKEDKAIDACTDKVKSARAHYENAKNKDNKTAASIFISAVNDANEALSAARQAGLKPDISSFEMAEYTSTITKIDGAAAVAAVYGWNSEDIAAVGQTIAQMLRVNACGPNCKKAIGEAQVLLTGEQTEANAALLLAKLAEAKQQCNAGNAAGATACSAIAIPQQLRYEILREGREAIAGREEVKGKNLKEDTKFTGFKDKLDKLGKLCEEAHKGESGDERKSRRNANLIAGAVGTVAGGALGFAITKSVQKAKYESAANEAVAQWMSEIGEHIQCYLGAEELGSYGDVISFTIE